MGFQSENRLKVHLLVLCWFLASILLATDWSFQLQPFTLLSCYSCPLQKHARSCTNVTSQCSPDRHCASSCGFYGAAHVLSAQGCMGRVLCDSHDVITYRGARYNVTHTCCNKNTCNEWQKLQVNISNALREELQDSLNNYTRITTVAPNATGEMTQTLIATPKLTNVWSDV